MEKNKSKFLLLKGHKLVWLYITLAAFMNVFVATRYLSEDFDKMKSELTKYLQTNQSKRSSSPGIHRGKPS